MNQLNVKFSNKVQIQVIGQESGTISRMSIDNCNRSRLNRDYSYVPSEIWLEILSRLQIKPLFVCQVVCKLWREIVFHVTKKIEPTLPVCGLVLRKGLGPLVDLESGHTPKTYICLATKSTLDCRELSIASGYDQGLMAELMFNFRALGAVDNLLVPERNVTSLTSHKGLLLVDYIDGTYEVHNPVTKQIINVPKSKLFERYKTVAKYMRGSNGLIVNLSDYSRNECSFVILRFSRKFNRIEMYYSVTKRWSVLMGLYDVKGGWSLSSYVAIYKTQTLSLYFLTSTNHGIVSNIHNLTDPIASSFAFSLPTNNYPMFDWKNIRRQRIWENDGNLLLSCCDPKRLRLLKADVTSPWEWDLLFEISNSEPLRNVVGSAREDLVQLLKADDRLHLIAVHPYEPIIYVIVKKKLLGYHIVNDTLVDIVETDNIDFFKDRHPNVAYPFIPCITSFHEADLNSRVNAADVGYYTRLS